jgi:hypothetical protein
MRLIVAVPFVVANVFIAAPADQTPVDYGSFVAVAALLATALSLAFTVTLLVAQHMAERHARELYREFRGDRVWPWTLAVLGLGVIAILAMGAVRPTRSSEIASLWLTLGLGLTGVAVFPHILDTLDRVVLVERVTTRFVRRISERRPLQAQWRVDHEIRVEADRGVAVLSGLATEAVGDEDEELIRAAVRGVGEVLLACLRNVSVIDMVDPTVVTTFQRLDILVDACARRSPVLLLPVVIEQLTALGVEGASVPNYLNSSYEPISSFLEQTMGRVVELTSVDDRSAAAALATHAVGEVSVALVGADRANAAYSQIGLLHEIGVAMLDQDHGHITSQALRELARSAVALAGLESSDIMVPAAFGKAAGSLADLVERFHTRKTSGRLRDMTLTSVLGPLSDPNLAAVVLRGAAASEIERVAAGDFGRAADTVYHSLINLLRAGPRLSQTPGNALSACTSVVVGGLALVQAGSLNPERLVGWWSVLVDTLIDFEVSGVENPFHVLDDLEAVLTLTTHVAVAPNSRPGAGDLRSCLAAAAAKSGKAADPKTRRRLASAWRLACGSALLMDPGGLGTQLLKELRPGLVDLKAARARAPWSGYGRWPMTLLPGISLPSSPEGWDATSALSELDRVLEAESAADLTTS